MEAITCRRAKKIKESMENLVAEIQPKISIETIVDQDKKMVCIIEAISPSKVIRTI